MRYKKLLNPLNSSLIISSILLLIYSGYRSSTLSFTHDESYSFIHYVRSSVIDIFTYNLNPIIANSHILNTLFMKWFGGLFGNSEFILRLHSFFAHFIYIIFTYLILKEFQSKFLLILGFIVLNFNPYLLDFFSLARGYALSIAFMVMSVYYFIQFTKYQKNSTISISLLMSVLSVLANFSLISFSASLIMVFELFFILNKVNIKSIAIKNIPVLFTLIALILIYYGPIKVLMDHNELNFGGSSGLWSDTVISSIVCYLYTTSYFDTLIVFLRFLVVFVSITSLIILYQQFKTKTFTSLSYISMLLFLMLLSSILQHVFLKGSYFKERFALFLVPLFFFAFLNVINYLIQYSKILKITSCVFAILVIGCSLNITFASINKTQCYAWGYDANTKEMLSELTKDKSPKTKVTLGITWLFEPTINFYRETKKLNWLEPVNRNGLVGDYDYYYVDSNDLNSFDKSNKIFIKTFYSSGATLYKKIK